MYTDERKEKLISARALGAAAALHAAFFLSIWVAGCVMDRPSKVIIPIDMTIVPPEQEEPPPEPEPPKPKVKPKEPDPPKATDKLDAVEKVPEKKKEEKRPEVKKPEEKKPDPPKPKRNAVKPPDPKNLKHGKKPVEPKPPVPRVANPKDKPLSAEEIAKALAMGAKFGESNSLPANEEQRCVAVIRDAIFREWDKESFSWYPGLKSIRIKLVFGPGGQVKGWTLVGGSGSAEVDGTAKRALSRVKSIRGLSAGFLDKYPTIDIELEPKGH